MIINFDNNIVSESIKSEREDSADVKTILVRYCEVGLKSTPVRRRFENILKDNMLSMLSEDGVEALVKYEDARYFIDTDDIEKCIASVKKVFGLSSLSVTEQCTSDMRDICRTAAEYSRCRISEGQSFAVKARREGTHPYTSMDVGREVGSAIFIENEKKNVKVDLTNPDKVFYIEVRNNRAYIFDEYIACPGGLPLGSQGRVTAYVNDKRGLVSAWMMMKRGCRVSVKGDYGVDVLRKYDPSIGVSGDPRNPIGAVLGTSAEGLEGVDVSSYDVPVYFPTIGMDDSEVDSLYRSIIESDFRT